jgi:hypothetical protein
MPSQEPLDFFEIDPQGPVDPPLPYYTLGVHWIIEYTAKISPLFFGSHRSVSVITNRQTQQQSQS